METEKYPIVKIDRTTAQEMLPIFMNRGIFSNYDALPTKEELLGKVKLSMGKDKLTPEEERCILFNEGRYRTKNYIIRDYGKYVIGFGLNFLMNEAEEEALERLSLYKLGHRLATIILSEVYSQRKFEDVVITKERILELLGFSSYEKQIYRQIDDAMFSLMSLNFFVHEYKTNLFTKLKSRELGYFIYNVTSDQKKYVLSVNKNFVGCIADVICTDTREKKNFSRGYFSFPTSMLPASKDFSTPAYLLSNFLIMDSGNAKLNTKTQKVVSYSVKYLLKVMKIEATRVSEIKKAFVKALKEVKLTTKITPSLKELSEMKPSKFIDQTIRFYLPEDVEKLDGTIKSNYLPAKWG
jgi:hypothetical protein